MAGAIAAEVERIGTMDSEVLLGYYYAVRAKYERLKFLSWETIHTWNG